MEQGRVGAKDFFQMTISDSDVLERFLPAGDRDLITFKPCK